MSLKILGTIDRGKPNLERVLLEAAAPLNLSFYVVMHSAKLGEGVASGAHPAFWFPTVSLAAGQRVQLFTGSNLEPQKTKPGNYFWGLKQTILNSTNDCLVVMQVLNWQSTIGEVPQPLIPVGFGYLGDVLK